MAKKYVNSEIMKSIQQYIEKISKYYKIDAIILFGSYAKGTFLIKAFFIIIISCTYIKLRNYL